MPQPPPDGLHLGGEKPPLPEGTPWGRMAPADISRRTSVVQQDGHWGAASWLDRLKCSNSQLQLSHRYS
jgi:hypothetical protein